MWSTALALGFVCLTAAAAAVWTYINFAGFGRSLRYQLPSPPAQAPGTRENSSGNTPDNSAPGNAPNCPESPGIAPNRPETPPQSPGGRPDLPGSAEGSSESAPGVRGGYQPLRRASAAAWGADTSGGGGGGVVILVPGRDEAEHLPTTLRELCEQGYPGLRVVFVDDASTDATPEIAAQLQREFAHLAVVRNEGSPPAGWMGKCWAIYRGYEALRLGDGGRPAGAGLARGSAPLRVAANGDALPDWLCFTDADIHWHPRLLATAVAYAEANGADLLGLAPTLRFGSPIEAIVQLQLFLALGIMIPFEKAMDPASPLALTGGAFIMVRREFYDAIGGHAAVKGEMVEDLKLGMALKAAGARHRVAMAGDLLWCRMYDGPADMWEGLTKNAYAGLGHRWYLAAPAVLAVLLLNALPPLYVLISAAWLVTSPGALPAVALILSLLTVVLTARALNATRKMMRLPAWYAWTMTPGSAIYCAIIVTSAVRHHTVGNAWKGRRYGAGEDF